VFISVDKVEMLKLKLRKPISAGQCFPHTRAGIAKLS